MHRAAAALLLFLTLATHADEARIEKLLREMTHEEKLGQLTQYAIDAPQLKDALAKGLVGSMLNTAHAGQVNELQRAQLAGSRHRIPILVGHDVLHGYRAEIVARVSAREARAAGIRWTPAGGCATSGSSAASWSRTGSPCRS